MLIMSKIIRAKYNKEDDMIFISHLDLQRLLQRAFRRAEINLSYSQGFNPHPKMSYGNALALGVESQGEYVDIEIEDDITVKEFLDRINAELPKGVKFIKAEEITSPLSKELVKTKVLEFTRKESIMITKKNKKGKLVENDIRPLIKTFDLVSIDDERATFEAIIATGSKGNLNINILVPIILNDILGVEMDQREVEVIRRDLYAMKDGELVTPL